MANTDDIQVLIPYRRLVELLKASDELEQLRKELTRLEQQNAAMRLTQAECMEKIREIEKSL